MFLQQVGTILQLSKLFPLPRLISSVSSAQQQTRYWTRPKLRNNKHEYYVKEEVKDP